MEEFKVLEAMAAVGSAPTTRPPPRRWPLEIANCRGFRDTPPITGWHRCSWCWAWEHNMLQLRPNYSDIDSVRFLCEYCFEVWYSGGPPTMQPDARSRWTKWILRSFSGMGVSDGVAARISLFLEHEDEP